MAKRIDDARREAVMVDAYAGMNRRAIALKHGLSTSTVTLIARDAAHTFDRGTTVAATKVRIADMAAARADLAAALLKAATDEIELLGRPCVEFNFGGKDNTYNEHTFDKPTNGARAVILGNVNKAIASHLALVKHDADPGLPAVRSLLDVMAMGIQAKFGNGDDLVTDDE
jgi:hypothetical protein